MLSSRSAICVACRPTGLGSATGRGRPVPSARPQPVARMSRAWRTARRSPGWPSVPCSTAQGGGAASGSSRRAEHLNPHVASTPAPPSGNGSPPIGLPAASAAANRQADFDRPAGMASGAPSPAISPTTTLGGSRRRPRGRHRVLRPSTPARRAGRRGVAGLAATDQRRRAHPHGVSHHADPAAVGPFRRLAGLDGDAHRPDGIAGGQRSWCPANHRRPARCRVAARGAPARLRAADATSPGHVPTSQGATQVTHGRPRYPAAEGQTRSESSRAKEDQS